MPDKKTRSSYNRKNDGAAIGKKIFHLLPQKQKLFFLLILLILGMSAVLSQLTPLSIGYLTDSVLAGSRQHIAIARIFLRKPKILLLDEATSALDNTSEKLIQSEIEKMNRECDTTVISIAHRLSTLRNCDEIIVMEHGRIIQKGTFQTLEHSPGVFHDMVLGILK